MDFLKLKDIKEKEIVPGYHGRFVHSPNMTLAFWNVEAGAFLPEHSHPHEQIMTLMEGQFEFVVEGKKEIHESGSVVVIPPNVPHSGKAVTVCKIVDVFHPQREEYR